MFEASLKQKLTRIFDLDKCTFNLPGESQEQEVLFIEVDSAHSRIKDKLQVCKVIGKLRVFAQLDKLPYGYFAKKIQEADIADTKDLFFYDIEENQGTFENIAERVMSFIYFFNSQYNPNIGTITELDLSVGAE